MCIMTRKSRPLSSPIVLFIFPFFFCSSNVQYLTLIGLESLAFLLLRRREFVFLVCFGSNSDVGASMARGQSVACDRSHNIIRSYAGEELTRGGISRW